MNDDVQVLHMLTLSWLVCSAQSSPFVSRQSLWSRFQVLAGTLARAATAPGRTRRMEAYNKRGKQLNGLNIADCAGGPHELRGLVRNELQSTLAAQLADGVVRTSTGVKGVSHFDEGAARPTRCCALVQGVSMSAPTRAPSGMQGPSWSWRTAPASGQRWSWAPTAS
jgi:hypothetical protein